MKLSKILFSNTDPGLQSPEGRFWKDKRLAACLICVFLWGLLAHGYGLLHSNFSHDALNAFYATDMENQSKYQFGRFFVPVYRGLFRGEIILPWLIGMLALCYIGLSVYLIVRMLHTDSLWQIAFLSGVMTTNISMTAQIATYIHELDGNSMALLLAVFAVYLWKTRRGLLPFAAGSGLLMVSIGIYQSFFSVAITLMVLLSILDLFRDVDTKEVFWKGIRGILMLLCGGMLYFLFAKVFYAVTGIYEQGKTNVFDMNGITNPIVFYWNLVRETYGNFFEALNNGVYRTRIRLFFVLMEGILGLEMVCGMACKRRDIPRVLLISVLTALLPFAMNITYLLARGQEVHDLMHYSVWLTWFLFPYVTDWLCANSSLRDTWKKGLRYVSYALVILVLWQNVVVSNTAYMKKDAAEKATYSTMTRVLARIEAHEEYVFDETNVAFIGTNHAYGGLSEYGRVSSLIGMDFNNSIAQDTSIDYYNTYKAYFRYVLNYPINFCTDDTHYALKQNPEVAQMPAFPHKDCIQMIDHVLVVKMG